MAQHDTVVFFLFVSRLVSLLSGNYFSEAEVQEIESYMKQAVRLAEIARDKKQVFDKLACLVLI